MKRHFLSVIILASVFNTLTVFADTLVFLNGKTCSGTVIQTNCDEVLLLMDFAAFNYSKNSLKEIKIEPTPIASFSTGRISDFKQTISKLSKELWATNLTPIAATVIENGILRNVPYTSFKCGEDYEINIYGELEHPAGIEVGVYHKLCESVLAKSNCVQFIISLLSQAADRKIVQGLDLKKDLAVFDKLTFEVTPQTAQDAYGGWWVSVYSETELNLARASSDELKQISMAKSDAMKETGQDVDSAAWSSKELKLSRRLMPTIFTFRNKSGMVVSNAEVVSINDGVSLIWRKDNGASAGLVRLEDLPDNLRVCFGYNPVKTKAADDLQEQNREKWRQLSVEQAAQVAAVAQAAQNSQAYSGNYFQPNFYLSDSENYSGGGSVFVKGYTRKNGTYVQPYTRNAPHRR